MASPSRQIALLGSGEFEPWTSEFERELLARGRPGPVLVVPLASAPDGERIYLGWAHKGLTHYAADGVPAEALLLRSREDALDAANAERVRAASLVFFSGGNPAFLADALRDTPFWKAVLEEMDQGLAFAGCSAGACICGDAAPDSMTTELTEDVWVPGLRLVPDVMFAPHWDTLDRYREGTRAFFLARTRPWEVLVAIDEDTAVVGDGSSWRVYGKGTAFVLHEDHEARYGVGEGFVIPGAR